jgi:hypothetical protein
VILLDTWPMEAVVERPVAGITYLERLYDTTVITL